MEATATLRNWTITEWPYAGGAIVVYGHIYGDQKKRFPDGHFIHTSNVLDIVAGSGMCVTKNSIYYLEGLEDMDVGACKTPKDFATALIRSK